MGESPSSFPTLNHAHGSAPPFQGLNHLSALLLSLPSSTAFLIWTLPPSLVATSAPLLCRPLFSRDLGDFSIPQSSSCPRVHPPRWTTWFGTSDHLFLLEAPLSLGFPAFQHKAHNSCSHLTLLSSPASSLWRGLILHKQTEISIPFCTSLMPQGCLCLS